MKSAFLSSYKAAMFRSSLLFVIFFNLSTKLSYAQNLASVASPFFFLCQYHRDLDQPGAVKGEIALSVHIKDNPEYYEPGNVYEGILVAFVILNASTNSQHLL